MLLRPPSDCALVCAPLRRSTHRTGSAGLSSVDVTQRRAFHGANELSTSEDEPWWAKFLEKFKEPMIALLLGSATISLLLGQYDDAISITLVRRERPRGRQGTGTA